MSARLSAFICGKLSFFGSGDHARCPDHRRTLGSNCHRERAAKSGSPASAVFTCWGEAAGAKRSRSAEPTLQPSADVPSARHPTPIAPLLKAKAKPQFERPVESLSTPLFSAFQGSNRGQFWPCFLVQGVRSAEGRGAHVWPMFGHRFSGFQRSFLLPAWAVRHLPNYQITHLPNP
jgi:hypothetical protein